MSRERHDAIDAAMPRQRERTLALFDNSKSGPLTDKEVHDIRMAVMPYLLDDGSRSDRALLIARLIATIDARSGAEP